MHHDLERACRASLERSRARRRVLAERLAAVRRRRRRRGSSMSLAALGAVLALGAPLALGQTTAQAPVPTTVSAGSSGQAVTAVQAALGVTQSGVFDARTRRAVLRFQRAHGLLVDGIVGPQTAAALGLSWGPARPQATAASAGGGSATLAKIARCESGGNPAAISPDGRYRGKYQFTRATWRAMGGTGDPAAAPESEQDQRAAALLAARGTSPWPVCGR